MVKVRGGAARPVRGRARVDSRTKRLAARILPGEVAVIDHQDLDDVAVAALLERRVGAVLNAADSVTGRYPCGGPLMLLERGVPLVDCLGPSLLEAVREGETLEVAGDLVRSTRGVVGRGRRLSPDAVSRCLAASAGGQPGELARFLDNTLAWVEKERSFFLRPLPLPAELRQGCAGRHALVVVRGRHHREDLRAIAGYVREFRPLIIAVDGGADALRECGFLPDLIVGDMDSVSDQALLDVPAGRPVRVVHAYPGGRAPGLERLRALGLPALTLEAPGTSEDLALLLAYEMGAELIVAVGTHSSWVDFLDKGREGMASTFLARVKVGPRLVDARGVSILYQRRLRARHLWHLVAAALLPIAVAALLAPGARGLVMLWWMHLRVTTGL